MIVKRTLSWLGTAAFTVGLLAAAAGPAPAQTPVVISFHDSTIPAVLVQVRTGPTQEASVPYDSHTLKKGDTWNVDTNMPIFWRREVNPGSGDGKFTDWQTVGYKANATIELG